MIDRVNAVGRIAISIVVVLGFLGVLLLILMVKLQGNSTPDVLLVMLGALSSAFSLVVAYWVGSSAGSSAKDAAISDLAKKGNGQ